MVPPLLKLLNCTAVASQQHHCKISPPLTLFLFHKTTALLGLCSLLDFSTKAQPVVMTDFFLYRTANRILKFFLVGTNTFSDSVGFHWRMNPYALHFLRAGLQLPGLFPTGFNRDVRICRNGFVKTVQWEIRIWNLHGNAHNALAFA